MVCEILQNRREMRTLFINSRKGDSLSVQRESMVYISSTMEL